jgi:hypothetical protein
LKIVHHALGNSPSPSDGFGVADGRLKLPAGVALAAVHLNIFSHELRLGHRSDTARRLRAAQDDRRRAHTRGGPSEIAPYPKSATRQISYPDGWMSSRCRVWIVTLPRIGATGARPDHPISRRWMFGRIFGLDGREGYRKLRLEPLCCPHRLSRGTAPHEREYPRRKDRF